MCRDYRFKEKIYIYYRVTQSRPIKLSFHCLRLYITVDAPQRHTTPPCVNKRNDTLTSTFLLKHRLNTQQIKINTSNYGATRSNCENEVKSNKVPQMNCVDFYSKVTVSRQVQIRKQWQKEERIKDNN